MLKHSESFPGKILTFSILGVALYAVPSWALTPPELMITDGGSNSITINSSTGATVASAGTVSGSATLDTATGFYSWSGKVGTLTVGGVEGQVLSTTTPKLDLGMTTTPTGSGTLYIYFTNQFLTGTGPFYFNIAGSGSATFNAYLDPTNAFGKTQTIESGISFTFPPAQYNVIPTTNPFYETLEAVVTTATANFDDGVTGTAASSTTTSQNPLTLACGAANGAVGEPYASSLVASGGTSPYTFSITPANAISPLTLNASTGAIVGTPLVAGTLTFTAKVVSSGSSASTTTASCTIVVAPKITVQCPTSTATVNVYYSSSVPVTGGLPPYTYAVVFGSLPSGLTLNTSTGVISGTPGKSSETGAFKIQVTDSTGAVAYTSCSGSCSNGLTVSYGGGQPSSGYGQKGTSGSYNSNGLPLNCYGFATGGSPTNLYSNNVWGNTELGLSNSNNNNQIDSGHFVQFDISSHTSSGANGVSIAASTFDWNATFDVYGSNTQGSLGTLLASNLPADSNVHSVPNCTSYKYVCVKAHSGDCLISSVQFSYQCACAIDVSLGQSSGQGGNNNWGSCGFNGYGGGSGGNNGYGGGQNPGQCGW